MKSYFLKLFVIFLIFYISVESSINASPEKRKEAKKTNRKESAVNLNFFFRYIKVAEAAKNVSKLPKHWKLVGTVTNPYHSGQVIVATHKKSNIITVSMRGRSIRHIKNIDTELSSLKSKYPNCQDCEVNTSFWNQHKATRGDIDGYLQKALKVKPKAEIVVTGHGLGGALATLYAAHILHKWKDTYRSKLKVVTFGSPRVGNHKFVTYYNTLVGLRRIFRVVYKLDPFQFVPPLSEKYEHVGDVKYLFSKTNLFKKVKSMKDSDANRVKSVHFHANDHKFYSRILAKFYLRLLRRVLRRYRRR